MTNHPNARALHAFAAMGRLPDDYILAAERMLYEAEAGISRPEKPRNRFLAFLNSGLGAAVISGMVALAILAFVIRAGQTPPTNLPHGGPVSGTTEAEKSTIEISDTDVNYSLSMDRENYPVGTDRITVLVVGKNKGETVTSPGGWYLERITDTGAELVHIYYTEDFAEATPEKDEYASLDQIIHIERTPLTAGRYRLHATEHDGGKYVSVAYCEFTVGSPLQPPETADSPYTLSVPNTVYGSVDISVTVTAKEPGEPLYWPYRNWMIVKLAGPENTGSTEFRTDAIEPRSGAVYASHTESLILEDPSAWLPGIYRLHDLNSKGESVAHCDFVIYEEGYTPLTTENHDHIVVPGIFLWANNTPMIVLMDYYDELYPEPNPSYEAVAVMYPILLVNDQRDGGSGMDIHSGSIVEVEIGKKITYPHYGDLYDLRVVTEGTLDDVNDNWLTVLREAGYTIRDTAEAETVDKYGFYEGNEVIFSGRYSVHLFEDDPLFTDGNSFDIFGRSSDTKTKTIMLSGPGPAPRHIGDLGYMDPFTIHYRESVLDAETGEILYHTYAFDYMEFDYSPDGQLLEFRDPADSMDPLPHEEAIALSKQFLEAVSIELSDDYVPYARDGCGCYFCGQHSEFTFVYWTREIGGVAADGYLVWCGDAGRVKRFIPVNTGMYEKYGYISQEQVDHTRARLLEALSRTEDYNGDPYDVVEGHERGALFLGSDGNLYLGIHISGAVTDLRGNYGYLCMRVNP